MKPINDWIIVETEDPVEVSAGGIILPNAKKNQSIKKSKVLAISDDVCTLCEKDGLELQYSIGDIVYHHAQTGLKVDLSDERDKRYYIKYDAVMGVECDK